MNNNISPVKSKIVKLLALLVTVLALLVCSAPAATQSSLRPGSGKRKTTGKKLFEFSSSHITTARITLPSSSSNRSLEHDSRTLFINLSAPVWASGERNRSRKEDRKSTRLNSSH